MSDDPFQLFAVSFPHFPGAICSQSVVDPDWWFPESLRDPDVRKEITDHAVSLCGACIHKTDCMQFALDNEIRHGIWGALLPEQRRSMVNEKEQTTRRQKNLNQVRSLLDYGYTLEQACDEVGIAVTTYDRYLQYEKHGWPTTTYHKAKQTLK